MVPQFDPLPPPSTAMGNRISFIIPVYNEARAIHGSLARLLTDHRGEPLEVIVVDGHPSGTTLGAIRHRQVAKITAPKGRAVQMNAGAAAARGDILLFLHADTLLPPDGLHLIRRTLAQQNVVGGAFDLGIESGRRAFRLIETVVSLRTRLTKIPYGDQAIFLDSRFFHEIGGFKAIPIMEDVELMRRIKRLGKKIAVIPRPVQTSPRRWETDGILYGTLRNWALITLYLAGVRPEKLTRFYR